MSNRIPCIVTVGEHGRAVVFGWVEKLPRPGEPCELFSARMILSWTGSAGLFGVAARGPAAGSRLTATVDSTWCVAHEVLAVSTAAAELLSCWAGEE